MKKFKSLLIPIILFSSPLYSQDTVVMSYKFDFTGILNSVNGINRTVVNTSASNLIKWKKFESAVVTEYQLLSDDRVSSVNDFTLRIQPRIVDDHYSVFAFGQISSLESKKITQRFEGGLGGGRSLFKTKSLESTLSYAVLFYSNNFQDLTYRDGLRHSPRFQFWGKSDSYKINYYFEIFYQPSTSDLRDYILRSKSSFGFDLNKKFTLNASYQTWYESFYIVGSRNNVKTLTLGTSYKIN